MIPLKTELASSVATDAALFEVKGRKNQVEGDRGSLVVVRAAKRRSRGSAKLI